MDAHQKVLFVDAATGYYRISRFALGDFYGPVDLGLHLAVGQPAAQLDKAVREGRFAVVDVRDDGEITYVPHDLR